MDGIVSDAKTYAKQTGDIFMDIGDAPSVLTEKSKRDELITGFVGLYGATIVGGIITFLPFKAFGRVGDSLKTLFTAAIALSMFNQGIKSNSLAWKVGGTIMSGFSAYNLLGVVGLQNRLTNPLRKSAETGYYGHMNLDGYEAIDSVEVDRSSYQPTQDYGAETIEQQMTEGTPQVEIAQEMVGNNLDSVRQEAAMGHGVTQWFGAENMNSATSFNKRMDMKKFAASTDVGGNRTRTGDDTMANVVGGTSMADSAPAMTAYDVSMEAGILPQTKELGGGVQDVFDTYILPSYEMPSAGASGHGVTQWYAESNQSGFIGNFVAGAEGHGSVLGQ